jgi:hypothetical protein
MIAAIKCLKPGGFIIFLDYGGMLAEDRNALYKAATSTNPEWSWYQRMQMSEILAYRELSDANMPPVLTGGTKKLGNDSEQARMNVQKGFWDFEGCDPSKCGALEAFIPLGDFGTR